MKKLLAFLRLVWRRFDRAGGLDAATVLAWTTLLSLVPLFALVVSVLSVSDWFVAWREEVVRTLVHTFSPGSLEKVEQGVMQLSAQAARLTGPSLAFLFITVLLLLDKIYRKIAAIWHEEPVSRMWHRLLHYLGVSLLGPLLIALGFSLSAALAALPLLDIPGLAWVRAQGVRLLPVAMTIAGFYLLYRYAPPVPIRPKAALAGAVTATVLLALLKGLFVLYARYASYKVVYGALAALPMFMVWLYLLWAMVLWVAALVWALDKALISGQFPPQGYNESSESHSADPAHDGALAAESANRREVRA